MVRYDPVLVRFYVGDKRLHLTQAETEIVNLLRFFGTPVSARDLAALVYGENDSHARNAVATCIARIRRKCADIGAAHLLSEQYSKYCWCE